MPSKPPTKREVAQYVKREKKRRGLQQQATRIGKQQARTRAKLFSFLRQNGGIDKPVKLHNFIVGTRWRRGFPGTAVLDVKEAPST